MIERKLIIMTLMATCSVVLVLKLQSVDPVDFRKSDPSYLSALPNSFEIGGEGGGSIPKRIGRHL